MCFIYAINIADRYVVSTVLEPIRLELHLTDNGVAFLTGMPLALFYVAFGIPISWMADRMNRRNILALSLIIWSAFTVLCGLLAQLSGVPARADRRRHRRGGRDAPLDRDRLGLLSGRPPPDGDDGARARRAHRRVSRRELRGLRSRMRTPGGWPSSRSASRGSWWASWSILTVREPARGRLDGIVDEIRPSLWQSLQFLWQQKAAFHVVMGGGLCALWGWGLMYWTPDLPAACLRPERQSGGRCHGQHPPHRRLARDHRHRLVCCRGPRMADPRRVVLLLSRGIASRRSPRSSPTGRIRC